ncbi:hypothetical protein K490DRAFT_57546 [Saccharata proteae CBS 121410]|uniref:F-box domain-containing protein n=1 Tax=Saccharata proteae CBS 121410 TaxID=1314787 RepID=A0A9P4HWP5_9PEZI|nr:hypothetical protein K490DRAFT_57546 [Saccharata proteae CBS 121410]
MTVAGILDLPPELLCHILSFLDPPTFSVALRTSIRIRAHAREIRGLLQDKLERIPGRTQSLRMKSNDDLVDVFIRRAYKTLRHGVGLADTVKLVTSPGLIKVNESIFGSCTCPDQKDGTLIAAVGNDGTVRVSRPIDRRAILCAILHPQVPLPNNTGTNIRYHVEKVAFHNSPPFYPTPVGAEGPGCLGGISVLYRTEVIGDDRNPIVQAAKAVHHTTLKLVSWRLAFGMAYVDHISVIPIALDWAPTALAIAHDGRAVIVFRTYDNVRGHGWTALVHLQTPMPSSSGYTYESDPSSVKCLTEESLSAIHDDEPPPNSIKFLNHNIAQLYSPFWPTPRYTVQHVALRKMTNSAFPPGAPTNAATPFTVTTFGIPLGSYHEHYIHDTHRNRRYCLNTVLHLNICRPDLDEHKDSAGAYIFKAVHRPRNCTNADIVNTPATFDNHFVAKLVGLPVSHDPSTAHVLAVSPLRTRIAIATGARIQIWSLNPKAFLQKRRDASNRPRPDLAASLAAIHLQPQPTALLPPDQLTSDDDPAYLSNCGTEHYACWPRASIGPPRADAGNKVVGLLPVDLPSLGPVHSLEFVDEDRLWGWTGQGLARWKVADDCCKTERTRRLQWDFY